MSAYDILMAPDGVVFGEGATLAEAEQDALNNAYWSEDQQALVTRDGLAELFSEYRETGGARGLYVDVKD